MSARGIVALLCATLAFSYALPVYAHVPANPAGYVTDLTNTLTPATKQTLEKELSAFEASTTNQIAVAIVQNMEGDYIEHFAAELFKTWGIGTKEKDNGVLLVVSLDEHKLRIEVGYGLEGALTDSMAQRILDKEMTPLLRHKDYNGAVIAGVRAIEKATQFEYLGDGTKPLPADWVSWLFSEGWTIIIFLLFGIQWLGAILARTRSWWAGGVLGFAGAALLGWFFALTSVLTLSIIVLATLLGLIFDFFVSNAFQSASHSGATPPWWAGGSSIGGGSSGGGFGGFSGGSSGGGGASGSW